ncbi:MAG TPA: ABC transporter permease [Ruminiclostridium sp.]|nr:ABC transporter permease [Ruminiclostridium sp.]
MLMFVITYVLLNIIISGRIREMGLLSCLGLEPVRLSRIVITETALISLFSIPLGILLSILISFLFLSSTVGKLMGTVLIPVPEILLNFAFCFIVSILASLYPSMKLRGLSPVEATGFKSGFIPNAKNKSFPKLDLAHGKIKFALLFGVKNALRNKRRFFSVSAVIALLLAFFISFGQSVETDWILAGGRKGYTPDYTISVPYISYTNKGIELNRHVTPVTDKFLHSISSLKGISNIYEQRSVADECDDSDAYEYYFDFGKNVLPEQAEKYLDSVCPVKRSGYPNDFFVMAGIGGYGDKELEFAKKYLCEGDVDIAKMDSQPVILLPKYVNVVANVNIPCTRLKVGDKVTLIENGAKSSVDISILKRYTFTVGGFLNAMPFEQINGASNGFLAVMSAKQFEKLGTAHKGIMQIYLQKKSPSSDLTAEISRLSGKYGYTVTDNKNNFADKEYEQEQKNYKLCVYSLFCLVGLMIFLTVTSLLVSDIVMRGAEFTMLWAIGLKRGQLIVSVLSEFLLYGVLGSIVGSAVGILMVFSNKTLSSDQKLLTKLQLIPWTHIKIAVLLILVLCAAVSVLGIRLCTKNMSVRNITND